MACIAVQICREGGDAEEQHDQQAQQQLGDP
jgi:hypothetical protein